MSELDFTVLLILVTPPVVGLTAGYVCGLWSGRVVSRQIVAISVVASALYAAFMISTAVWAARCFNCHVGTEDSRESVLLMSAFIYGISFAGGLAGLWAGSLLGWALRDRAHAER